MNPAQLLGHFDRISDAPDAIPQLRRFILDLAVRGKLVGQDVTDEPAFELLKRIQVEKARLVAKRDDEKSEGLPPIDEGEQPFHVPESWVWVRVGHVFRYDAGTKREPRELEPSRWLVELEDIEKDTSTILTRLLVRNRESLSTKSEFQVGDILYGKLRPYLNKVVVAPEAGYSTTEIVAIRPFLPLCSAYCCMAFRRPDFVDYVSRLGRGTKMPRLRTPDAVVALFPLPPIAEQHRIVAKVDELMALCDQLEAAQAERERRRDRLTAASLYRLNEPGDVSAFRRHTSFHLTHLARLTRRPDQIPALRQTILNLAVRGRLVPQDASEGLASELVKQIRTEQEELVRARVLKRDNRDSRSIEGEIPFEIAPTWRWTQLGSLIVFGPQNGISPKPTSRPDAPKAITLTATTKGTFDPRYFKSVEATIPHDSEFWLRSGDLLFQRGNTREYVGIAAYYTGEPALFLYPDLMIKVRISEKVSLLYIHLCAVAPYARTYLSSHASGAQATMPKINQETLVALPIPLPPFAEQHRIVAKVEELMALCDRLEAQLTTGQAESRRLLEAVFHEVLAPAV